MPRANPVYSASFDGLLTVDVEDFLARFQHSNSVRYADFSAVWRATRLSELFLGVNSSAELRRFTRLTLETALRYFTPPYSYQVRVGGLYLLYGFYHTQLCHPPMKIRISLREWTHVQNFLRKSVESRHHDVVYVYQRLLSAKAFHFSALTPFLSFQKFRKPRQEPSCSEFLSRTTAIHDLQALDLLEEVDNIQGQYERLKEGLGEGRGQVKVTHQDLVSRIRDCMSEFLTWQERVSSVQEEEEEEEEEEEGVGSRRAELLHSIKQRSYGNFSEAPRSRRHRRKEPVATDLDEDPPDSQRKKRPESLRARTRRNLRVEEAEGELGGYPWSVGRKAAPC